MTTPYSEPWEGRSGAKNSDKLRVHGWSDGGSACEYYRLRVPADHLNDKMTDIDRDGYNYTVNPYLPWNEKLDVVIGQRINRPEPLVMWRKLAARPADQRPRLIYEIDDDLFSVPRSNPVFDHFANPVTRNVILDAMSVADAITVSTEPLAEIVRDLVADTQVFVIPNALPHKAYSWEWLSQSEISDFATMPATLGWSGSATHEEDVLQMAYGLSRALRSRDPRPELAIMGPRLDKLTKKLGSGSFRWYRWQSSMDDYYKALDMFDVGLVPVQSNTFNRSKSDLKALELFARGIPVIASDVGPYGTHVTAGRCMGAFTDLDWMVRINQTLDRDRFYSRQMTSLAQQYAWSQRRISVVVPLWERVLRGNE